MRCHRPLKSTTGSVHSSRSTAIFGIATIALLPMGIYQALSFAIVGAGPVGQRRQGGGRLPDPGRA